MSHQKFPPQYIFITYLWSYDTGCGGTWRCAVQTSLQGIVAQLLGVLPVGNLKHQAACSDPSRWRYKDLAIGCVRTTLKGHLHSGRPMGSAKVIGYCSSLILPSALSRFFPPDSTVLTPRATLIKIPALNSIWVCIPENQPATCIRKHSSTHGGLLFENYWLHMYLKHFKTIKW